VPAQAGPDRRPRPELRASSDGQPRIGTHPGDDQRQVGEPGQVLAIDTIGLDIQTAAVIVPGFADLPDRGPRQDLDTVPGQFGEYQRAQSRINGRQHFGQLLHLRDRQSAGGQGTAISRPT